jgi:hypothetical protein
MSSIQRWKENPPPAVTTLGRPGVGQLALSHRCYWQKSLGEEGIHTPFSIARTDENTKDLDHVHQFPRKPEPWQRLDFPMKAETPRTCKLKTQRVHVQKQTTKRPREVRKPDAAHRGTRHHGSLAHGYPVDLRLQVYPRCQIPRCETKRKRTRVGTPRSRFVSFGAQPAPRSPRASAIKRHICNDLTTQQ